MPMCCVIPKISIPINTNESIILINTTFICFFLLENIKIEINEMMAITIDVAIIGITCLAATVSAMPSAEVAMPKGIKINAMQAIETKSKYMV